MALMKGLLTTWRKYIIENNIFGDDWVKKDRKFVIFLGLTITFAIMFIGLLSGILIYNYQTVYADKELSSLSIRSKEISLFSSYLEQDLLKGTLDCNLYGNKLNSFFKYLYDYERIVSQYYTGQKDIDTIKYLQSDYVVASLDLYLNVNKFNSVCSSEKKNIVLYFYPYNCGVCDGITGKITSVVNDYNNIFEVSIPAEIGLESVEFVKDYYDVNVIPSLIVNGHTLQGSNSYKELENYLYK